jgi:hypothetical protein
MQFCSASGDTSGRWTCGLLWARPRPWILVVGEVRPKFRRQFLLSDNSRPVAISVSSNHSLRAAMVRLVRDYCPSWQSRALTPSCVSSWCQSDQKEDWHQRKDGNPLGWLAARERIAGGRGFGSARRTCSEKASATNGRGWFFIEPNKTVVK